MPSGSLGEPSTAVEADFVELHKAQRLLLMFRYQEEKSKKGKECGPGIRAEMTHRAIGAGINFEGNRKLWGLLGGGVWGCPPRITESSPGCKPRSMSRQVRLHRHQE